MPARYRPKWIEAAFSELDSENDRAVISVGGAYVEYALEEAILSRLRPPADDSESKIFFHDNGIIGTFFEKIWLAYFLKIIGPITRRDLDLIRKVRNIAAHDLNPISFENTAEISSRCRELIMSADSIPAKKEPQDLRGMFILSVRFYTANLLLRSGDSNAEIVEAAAALAPYLDR
jgi:hypothetical protein